ncbi:EthD family reductase [Nocardia terpenica]|uniref:Ethyl tert-butyl ether degradation protein EthD n=1 Tax=Nocardia terpenica TaxID=455432 RepID=A0A161XGL9_9NOCA|nr:EthD family reductase [Nocardia terpenica]KZM72638.1 ethyl tert-butyl ether degradation protein EthD [Nocardia terpenica]NQE92473.1 EthD family reductase [Nocardia terpenica]
MYRLTVLYPPPVDPDHFRTYYEEKHLPLARRLPNLRAMTYSLAVTGLARESPYFAIWAADFESAEVMQEALDSAVGRQLTADVPNYATGGALILHYPLHND